MRPVRPRKTLAPQEPGNPYEDPAPRLAPCADMKRLRSLHAPGRRVTTDLCFPL